MQRTTGSFVFPEMKRDTGRRKEERKEMARPWRELNAVLEAWSVQETADRRKLRNA